MKLKKFIHKTHKWLGLIIGLQVVFWVFGGLIMSSFPIEQVHGDHLRKAATPEPLDIKQLFPLAKIVKSNALVITTSTLKTGFNGPQYQLTAIDKKTYYFNALTGQPIVQIDETTAVKIAQSLYTGTATVLKTDRITENSTEYRKRIPAWRIEFDDNEASTLYIAADNGELMSVRNSMWRIFDFVWMLHIMDYQERDDFNNWLLIIAAALALIFSFSGVYLVFKTFRRKDFGLKTR